MSITFSVWIVVLLGLIAANAPFITERVLGFYTLATCKSLPIRVLELLGLSLAVGAFALILEKNAGQIAPQGWEFYAITGSVFLTFAFPGFVYCYLLKHK